MSTELRRRGYNNHAEVCVATPSRCGSTMMVLYLIKKLGKEKVAGVHARPFCEFDGKVIFMFGNVYNTVISVHARLRKSLKQHYKHMRGEYSRCKDFLVYDSLHIEELFDDWYRPHPFPMASVRYETLWENFGGLSQFLEMDLSDFPKKKKRKTNWHDLGPTNKKLIQRTYQRINNKIDSARDFKIW